MSVRRSSCRWGGLVSGRADTDTDGASKKKAARDVMRWNELMKKKWTKAGEAAVSVMRSLMKDIIRGCARLAPVGPESRRKALL